MIRRPPRSTQSRSSAASDVYKRQGMHTCSLTSDTCSWEQPASLAESSLVCLSEGAHGVVAIRVARVLVPPESNPNRSRLMADWSSLWWLSLIHISEPTRPY
eukprot:TRINITY_DN653_c0_g1_i2.p2 TRINITY_DN653_c0_g1~~TRINITY_DN653_c0_g1_i2.p2  ORF type:complete len:102 (+),score=44.93 TRINITY_DN653_c0_g1_i2:66-371(+)